MDHAPTPQTDPSPAIAGLLAMLRLLAERFADAYGAPAAMVKGAKLYGKIRDRALRWLHDMECVAKRLLLLRAAQFPPPTSPYIPSEGASRASRRKEGNPESLFGPSDDSSQWRVQFRIQAPHDAAYAFEYDAQMNRIPGRRASHARRVDRPMAYYADEPRPLAERFEAVLRVLNDPDAFAARLALRLHRWRGRESKRESFLRSLCATMQIANEAGLEDSDWDIFGAARELMQGLLPLFFRPAPALPDSG